MTEATKKANYTPEMVAKMVSVYGAAGVELTPEGEAKRQKAMESLATDLSRTVASIRSKLSFEKVYIPKVKATPKNSTTAKKSDTVTAIAECANDSTVNFESLENANRKVLDYIVDLQCQNLALENELFDTDEQLIADAAAVAAQAAEAAATDETAS